MKIIMTKEEYICLKSLLEEILDNPEMFPFQEIQAEQGPRVKFALKDVASMELLTMSLTKFKALPTPFRKIVRDRINDAVSVWFESMCARFR